MTKDLSPKAEMKKELLPEVSEYFKGVNDPVRQDQCETPQKQKVKQEIQEIQEPLSERTTFYARLAVFTFCLSFLVIGRAVIPANEVPQLVDHLMDKFNGINEYIRAHRNVQDLLLILCSFFMDVMFFATGFYWIFRGKNSRLIISTLFFYFLRTAVQQMWYSPFPSGYVWDDPGFPSLVVPYGRTSDFYFSGHIGIVTICACEWFKWKKYLASFLIGLGGLYTCFIMLAYQAHYSIDLFTGIVTGHWMFMIVDSQKDKFDAFFVMVFNLGKKLLKITFSQAKSAKAQMDTKSVEAKEEVKCDGRQETKDVKE